MNTPSRCDVEGAKRQRRPRGQTGPRQRLEHSETMNRNLPLTLRLINFPSLKLTPTLSASASSASSAKTIAILLVLSSLLLLTRPTCCLRMAPTSARFKTHQANGEPSGAAHADLIEGRLDTSQLCGMRYPTAKQQVHYHHEQPQAQQQTANDNLYYIIGGDEVDNDQFWPWSVAIYELDPLNGQRQFICSGSLISERFVLTAAHCIQQSRFDILSPDEIFLKIASIRLDDEHSSFYRVESVHVHPEYSVDRKANDIALLKLANAQRLPPRARPICLPSHVANRIDFTDQQVTIIGWGKTSAMQGDEPSRLIDVTATPVEAPELAPLQGNELGASDESTDENPTEPSDSRSITEANDTLLQAEVRVTSTDQCNRNYSKLEISWLNIDEHFLCASDPMGKRDACQGDSGGPLMWNNQQQSASSQEEKWYQLGLVSFGHGCANQQFPGVYTRISYYMPWILKTVNGRPANGNQQQQQHHQHQHHSLPTGVGRGKWKR